VLCFFGYDVYHSDDVYRLFHPKIKRIIESRDVLWLNKSDGAWIKSKSDEK
jgi:hypothetical protein